MSTVEAPLVRLQLRYPDENTFVQRFSPNVTRGGIFLANRAPHPVGTVISFEVALTQGPPLLFGTGKVAWVREFDPQEPQRAHGMGVQFIQIAPASRAMLERLLQHKNLSSRSTPATDVSAASPRPIPERGSAPEPISLTKAASPEDDPSTWIDDVGVRQAVERARVLASRIEDVEALRTREHEGAPTLKAALEDLPRILGPRRPSSRD